MYDQRLRLESYMFFSKSCLYLCNKKQSKMKLEGIMEKIKPSKYLDDQRITDIRNAVEQRAAWLYLLTENFVSFCLYLLFLPIALNVHSASFYLP